MHKWIAAAAVLIMLGLPVACSEEESGGEQNCYWVDGALKCVRGALSAADIKQHRDVAFVCSDADDNRGSDDSDDGKPSDDTDDDNDGRSDDEDSDDDNDGVPDKRDCDRT